MIPEIDPLTGMFKLVEKPQVSARGGGIARLFAGVGTEHPTAGVDGQLFYDTDDAILYVYANGIWNSISGGGPPVSHAGEMIGAGPMFGLTRAS